MSHPRSPTVLRSWLRCLLTARRPAPKIAAPAGLPESDTKREAEDNQGRLRSLTCEDWGGRYWDRTSDLLGVNEALSR
jgi:hypothetical protein